MGFSKTVSLGSEAKLALIYNTTSYEFDQYLNDVANGATPTADAFSITYAMEESDGYDYGSGEIIMHFNTTQPDATTFGACDNMTDDDIWNELELSIDRTTLLCNFSYSAGFEEAGDGAFYFVDRSGANVSEETIMVDDGIPFT